MGATEIRSARFRSVGMTDSGLFGCGCGWVRWVLRGEVRYASEVACAVKFLVSLKVKFYFRKIKDERRSLRGRVSYNSSLVGATEIRSARFRSVGMTGGGLFGCGCGRWMNI